MRHLLPCLALVALVATGCGRGAGAVAESVEGERVSPTSSTTSTPLSSTSSSVPTTTVAPDPEPVDTAPVTTLPAMVGAPEPGERLNEAGVAITLDETAALACANAEFARDSIGFDDRVRAGHDLNAAADRAAPSAVPDIAASADAMREALDSPDPLAVVESFLAICVEHGHQI